MGPEQRDRIRWLHSQDNWRQEDAMNATDKPFSIDKKLVYEAYKAVRVCSQTGRADRDATLS